MPRYELSRVGIELRGVMYVVVVFLEAKREHRTAVRAALSMFQRSVREHEPSCLRYEVSADPVDEAAFLIYQVYQDEAAHRAHRELQHYSDFHILIEPWTESRRVLTYRALD